MRIEDLLFDDSIRKNSFTCIDDCGKWDIYTLQERINKLSTVLQKNKVNRLEHVAMYIENSASFIVCLMAIFRVGAVAVPIDPQLPKHEVERILAKTKSKIVCLSGNRPETQIIKTSSEKLEYIVLSEERGDWEEVLIENIVIKGLSDLDPALILPTSGSTGESKAVVLSHRAIVLNVDSILDYMEPRKEDVFFVIKTMVHSSTISGEILVALAAGSTLIAINPRLTIRNIINKIDYFNTTILCLNPSILKLFCKCKCPSNSFKSVRLIYTSGALATAQLLKEAQMLFRNGILLNVYGLTEAGPRVTAERIGKRNGSVGTAIKGVEIFVVKKNGLTCDVNEQGLIFVKTNSIMLEYFEDLESTKSRITNGILNTNDVGFIDKEGALHIIGRADDIIVTGAHNIHPSKIEEVVNSCECVSECIVFGIPNETYGEKIVCIMQMTRDKKNKQWDVFEHCKNELAPYEVPHIFEVWGEIPLTSSGKISRNQVKKKYLERSSRTENIFAAPNGTMV